MLTQSLNFNVNQVAYTWKVRNESGKFYIESNAEFYISTKLGFTLPTLFIKIKKRRKNHYFNSNTIIKVSNEDAFFFLKKVRYLPCHVNLHKR